MQYSGHMWPFPEATEWYQTHCWALGRTMNALPNTGRLFALLILGSIVFT